MQLATNDVHSYSLNQLLDLFQLPPNFNEDQLQLSRQRLMAELPRTRQTSMTRPHEIALFIDCACNRLRDESKKPDTAGTWQQKTNPMIKGAGSHVLQESPNRIAGRNARITGGRYSDTNATPPGWLNPFNIKTTDIALSFDSKFRNDYGGTTSSDWSVDLPVTLNKVTAMRIASLEMPMSYYGVSMSAGNSTFLAVSCGNSGSISQAFYDFLKYTPPPPAPSGLGPPPKPGLYDLSDPSAPVNTGVPDLSIQAGNPNLWKDGSAPAWLVILPDGNYEIGWQDLNSAEDIVRGMGSAIQIAIPGKYHCATGQFRAFFTLPDWLRIVAWVKANNPPSNHEPDTLYNVLLSTYLSYDVNRSDGKSIFASSVTNAGDEHALNALRRPFNLHFAVDRGGNNDLIGSLQHKLGWMLGYRVGSYYTERSAIGDGAGVDNNTYGCGSDAPSPPLPIINPTDPNPTDPNPPPPYVPGFGAMSYISESVCNMEGPKYLYLCVTDGTNNHGSSLIGCFSESTFNKDIMLRINLAAGTYGVKVYRYFSLAGVASGWWRSRSYYGPVTIKRLRFRVFDEFGRLLDLNGLDWSMAVVFDQLYD